MMNCIEQLQKHEGFVSYYYMCTAGKKTIGYGRNVEAKPLPKNLERDFHVTPLTEEEAEDLLVQDVEEVRLQLLHQLPFDYTELSKPRQAVLINMAYNLGIAGLLKFKKALAAIALGDFDKAHDEMLDSRWAMQVKARAVELAEQMKTGSWQ